MATARRSALRRMWALLPLAVLLLSGCSITDEVAVGPSGTPGIPRGYAARCRGERVKSVRLTKLVADTDDDDPYADEAVLWQIDAKKGQSLDHVDVGETPPGFVAVVPARLPLPTDAELQLSFDGWYGEVFRLDELRPGTVQWSGRRRSLASYRRQARENCDPYVSTWVSVALVGTFVAASAVVIVLAIRKSRRPPSPPPGWHPDPWGTARLRWWDGRTWSGSVHA